MKHLTSVSELSRADALQILDTADEMGLVNQRQIRKLPTLRGKTVANLFYEDSTRTKLSFEIASKRLSAEVLDFSVASSSINKGESLKDTAQTLEALGVDAVVVRHPMSGAARNLAYQGWCNFSVINAGDGRHEHPTQALLDAMSIRESLGSKSLEGAKVLIVGDIANSRVARSNLLLLPLIGAEVVISGPASLLPLHNKNNLQTCTTNLDEALSLKPDFVMMLRVQLERHSKTEDFSRPDYIRDWQLSDERLRLLSNTAKIMHPGPMNRGLEISNQAADDERSLVLRQVANGVSVRMAVLYHLLGGQVA